MGSEMCIRDSAGIPNERVHRRSNGGLDLATIRPGGACMAHVGAVGAPQAVAHVWEPPRQPVPYHDAQRGDPPRKRSGFGKKGPRGVPDARRPRSDGALVGALQRRAAGYKVYPTGTCMCEMAGADAEAAHAPHARDHGRGGRARGAIPTAFGWDFRPNPL